MKKSLYTLLFTIVFSAFAFSPIYCGCLVKPVAKVVKKKVIRPSISPLADLVLLPTLNG